MKKSILNTMFLSCLLVLGSCGIDALMSDDAIIEAIQSADDKENITVSDLPEDSKDILKSDFSESDCSQAMRANGLGYELLMQRKKGSDFGKMTTVYFDKKGRKLNWKKKGKDWDKDGMDKQECFELNFPLTFAMPDASTITGNDWVALKKAMNTWYTANANLKSEPNLVYPVDITFEDGTIETMSDEAALKAAFLNCK